MSFMNWFRAWGLVVRVILGLYWNSGKMETTIWGLGFSGSGLGTFGAELTETIVKDLKMHKQN